MGFDFNKLKLPTTFEQGTITKKLVTTIPVRKPKSGIEFFRVRPESEWTFSTYLLDLKEGEEEKYLIVPELMEEVISTGKLKPVMIYAWISLSGQVFCLSDIPLPYPDSKDNEYNRSRRLAYYMAKTNWVKIQPNKALGAYEIIEAKNKIAEPVWPEQPATMEKALDIAFDKNLIESYDHPVLKRRGTISFFRIFFHHVSFKSSPYIFKKVILKSV